MFPQFGDCDQCLSNYSSYLSHYDCLHANTVPSKENVLLQVYKRPCPTQTLLVLHDQYPPDVINPSKRSCNGVFLQARPSPPSGASCSHWYVLIVILNSLVRPLRYRSILHNLILVHACLRAEMAVVQEVAAAKCQDRCKKCIGACLYDEECELGCKREGFDTGECRGAHHRCICMIHEC